MGRLRIHTCLWCPNVADLSLKGCEPNATSYSIEIITQPMLCNQCHTPFGPSGRSLSGVIPSDLKLCNKVSFLADRWLSVGCEPILRNFANCMTGVLVAELMDAFGPNDIITDQQLFTILNRKLNSF